MTNEIKSNFSATAQVFRKKKMDESGAVESQAATQDDLFIPYYTATVDTKALMKPSYDFKSLRNLVADNSTLPPCVAAMEVNIDGTGFTIQPSGKTKRAVDESLAKELEKANTVAVDQLDTSKQTKDKLLPQDKQNPKPQDTAVVLPMKKVEPVDDDELFGGGMGGPDPEELAKENHQKALDALRLEGEGIGELFNECYPNTSFLSVRREMRRDQEEVGIAYLEVIRSATDEIVFLRRVIPETIRLVKLETVKVPVVKKVVRNGSEFDVTVLVSERRYAEIQGTSLHYFKEYGASRDLNRRTGEWAAQGARLAVEDRATELIEFGVVSDPNSSYSIPRWVSQAPAIIGQRESEELNLSYFDNGGVPPVVMTLVGGQFTPESKELLEGMFSGRARSKLSGAVVEVIPTSGSLDSDAKATLTVERFGSESQSDSMFDQYDTKCEVKIRGAFRLPPIFVGKTEEYNYATAFASYMVAEEQVFAPERREFDEIINSTIMRDPSMGAGKYVFVSNPLTVKDIETQLRVLEFAVNLKAITNESYIRSVNSLTNLDLEFSGKEPSTTDLASMLGLAAVTPLSPVGGEQQKLDANGKPVVDPAVTKKDMEKVVKLSYDVSRVMTEDTTPVFKAMVTKAVSELPEVMKPVLRSMVARDLLSAGMKGEAHKLIESNLDL